MTNHEATDTDTISRQAAYDTLTEYYHHKTDIQHKALREALSRVPSAQLANKSPKVAKEFGELISRQMAIDALKEALNPSVVNFVKAKMAIEALPSSKADITKKENNK